MVYQSFQARDQIPAGAATHTTAAAKSRALPHCAGLGIEPAPPQRRAGSLTHGATARTANEGFLSPSSLKRKKKKALQIHNRKKRK